MSPDLIHTFFQRLSTENPAPETELAYINTFTLLVAVVLSAQSTDKGVNRATKNLFIEVSTPQEMLSLGEERLTQYIRTIGLYKTKAKNVIKLSQILVDKFGGEVPEDRQDLESLPGVGRKTANVVLNVAFGRETFPVDTHVFRVCNRTEIACGKTPVEVEGRLEAAVPTQFRKSAHHLLILHGRYTCTARAPKCPICPVRDLCPYPHKTGALLSEV